MTPTLGLESHLHIKNDQRSGFPCWRERPWLSQERGVHAWGWQAEESPSVCQATIVLGPEWGLRVACKLIVLPEVTVHKSSQNPGLPLLNIWGVYQGCTDNAMWVHKHTEQKVPYEINWKIYPMPQSRSIESYSTLDPGWKLNRIVPGWIKYCLPCIPIVCVHGSITQQ